MRITNEIRREVMQLAWGLYRADGDTANPRTFADALAGAWAFVKRAATAKPPKWARGRASRTVCFSSLVSSPIDRTLGGQLYAATKSRHAARFTSRIGG